MGNGDSFPGGKAAASWRISFSTIFCRGHKFSELYLHSTNTPSWWGAQFKQKTFTFNFITDNRHSQYHVLVTIRFKHLERQWK